VKDTTADVKATTSPINIAPPLWTAKKTASSPQKLPEKQPEPPPEPEITPEFSPPPPGPVKLGVPGLSDKKKPAKIPADKMKNAGEDKLDIDPDDYSDLISI
jgi:hypothetical protein